MPSAFTSEIATLKTTIVYSHVSAYCTGIITLPFIPCESKAALFASRPALVPPQLPAEKGPIANEMMKCAKLETKGQSNWKVSCSVTDCPAPMSWMRGERMAHAVREKLLAILHTICRMTTARKAQPFPTSSDAMKTIGHGRQTTQIARPSRSLKLPVSWLCIVPRVRVRL